MMSICLTWFPKRVLGPIYTIICSFYKNVVDFIWRVSDCEELMGVTYRGNDGVGRVGNPSKRIPNCTSQTVKSRTPKI